MARKRCETETCALFIRAEPEDWNSRGFNSRYWNGANSDAANIKDEDGKT